MATTNAKAQKIFEKARFSSSYLIIHGFLTDSERAKVHSRMVKWMKKEGFAIENALFEFRHDRYKVVSRAERWFVYDPDLGEYLPARDSGDARVVTSMLNKALCTKKSYPYRWLTEKELATSEGKQPWR